MTNARLIRWVRWLGLPRCRYVLSWAGALVTAVAALALSWRVFDTPKYGDGTPKRRGGNSGHTLIDFGGQWLMGRMTVLGLGRRLYDRNYLRPVVVEAYPRSDEMPDEEKLPEDRGHHEADTLMTWLLGTDDPAAAQAVASLVVPLSVPQPLSAVTLAQATWQDVQERQQLIARPQLGGPLYPPIHALFMYPLGHLRPVPAYRLLQILNVLLAFVAGAAVQLVSGGWIWWPVASFAIMVYPGFAHAVNLGQNSVLVLALFAWGWALVSRERPLAAGLVWGLLAFKPVWAAAFFVVPLITGRWRVCLAMLLTGAVLAAATLPVVGWENWIHWFELGRMATYGYHTDENWVFLSRDLLNIARRWLVDFRLPVAERRSLISEILGWSMLAGVVLTLLLVAVRRRDRRQALVGPPASFLLLGAWLTCFHFMFYDVLLTALPILLLLVEWPRYLEPVLLARLPMPAGEKLDSLADYQRPWLAQSLADEGWLPRPALHRIFVLNSLPLTLIALLGIVEHLFPQLNLTIAVSIQDVANSPIPFPLKYSTSILGTPWGTFCLLALWVWCAWVWLMRPQPGQKTREE
jgi:hypothetical protein